MQSILEFYFIILAGFKLKKKKTFCLNPNGLSERHEANESSQGDVPVAITQRLLFFVSSYSPNTPIPKPNPSSPILITRYRDRA